MLSRKALLMALGASEAMAFDASIAYGSTCDFTIQFGMGLGVKASSTAIRTTAINAPRTRPKAPPSKRSSQESPVHLNSFDVTLANSAPIARIAQNTKRKPIRFDTAAECR